MLKKSLPEDIRWMGHLPRDDFAAMPERHLGLLPAAEIADLSERLNRMADALAKTEAALLPPTVEFAAAERPQLPPLLAGTTIAVARDAAFCFLYPANLDCLQAMGANLVFFSPLADAALPTCDAVWLPGGYPELHGKALAANRALWAALAKHVAAGKPLFAECGGMMALFETLVDIDGNAHWMGSLIPGTVTMQKKLAALGMQEVALDGHPPLRGHTFHYSSAQAKLEPFTRATRKQGASEGEPVYRHEHLTASYLHLYFPSSPVAAAGLFTP